jgi:hypothetical protein
MILKVNQAKNKSADRMTIESAEEEELINNMVRVIADSTIGSAL